jgi:hypothetical protein
MRQDSGRLSALIRFQMATGGRVALRANAIVAATFVFVFGSAPDGLATLRALVLGTVSSARGWGVLAILAGVCLALASAALPRITLGSAGWMRSLPATRVEHGCAAIVALSAAQFFSIAWAAACVVLTRVVYHAPVSIAKLLVIPVIVVGMAAFALLTARSRLRRRDPARLPVWRVLRGTSLGFLHWVRFSWAALPAAAVLGSLLLPIVFVGFAYLIIGHNPDLAASTYHRTVRMAGSLALGALAASLSNALLRARPTWPWSRSLPWSSSQRIVADAVALGAPLLLVTWALTPLDLPNALATLLTIPAIALAGAAALRVGARRQTGAAGEVVVVATIAGALIAVSPALAILPLVGTPFIARFAAERDRRMVSSRFVELQHDAAADAVWLGAR